MRIALIIYGALEILSGGYFYDQRVVEYIQRLGESVEIISIPNRNYFRCLSDNFNSGLFHRLKDLKIDILLQDELNHPSLFLLNSKLKSYQASRGAKFPLVSIVHHLRSSEKSPLIENFISRIIEKRYLSTLDGCIYNSQSTQQSVQELAGRSIPSIISFPGRDRFSYQGDEANIQERSKGAGPLRLLSICNLIPRKGLQTLIDSISLLPNGVCRLTVVGSAALNPSYAIFLQNLVRARKLMEVVRFMGPLDDRSVSDLLTTSHVMVMPSTFEGFGMVYLEGMGFGLPAIGTTRGAAREVIKNGQNGYLISPGDFRGLADHLMTLHQDRKLLTRLSLAARRAFMDYPTWAQTCERIYCFLKDWHL